MGIAIFETEEYFEWLDKLEKESQVQRILDKEAELFSRPVYCGSCGQEVDPDTYCRVWGQIFCVPCANKEGERDGKSI